MKILVTGGAGFIGSHLVRHLLETPGHEVLNIDALTYAGNLHSIADLAGHPRHRFTRLDITDAPALAAAVTGFAPDWIIHLAAESHVDRSIDAPANFIQTNILGTFHLLQSARAHFDKLTGPARERFRFVHVSTDEVYGELGASGRFREDSPYAPRSPYSASKAAADHLTRAWAATYDLPVLVTHCSNNYGPYQFPEKLIPVVILNALRGETIPVYGRGENRRDWLHVTDHAAALHAVAARGRPGQTYNIGADNEWTNLDLVRHLCGVLDNLRPRPDGRPHADLIDFVADRPGHDFRYAIDSAKIRAKLGWSPSIEPAAGLRATVAWYLENEAWWRAILDGSYKSILTPPTP